MERGIWEGLLTAACHRSYIGSLKAIHVRRLGVDGTEGRLPAQVNQVVEASGKLTMTCHSVRDLRLRDMASLKFVEDRPCSWKTQLRLFVHETVLCIEVCTLLLVTKILPAKRSWINSRAGLMMEKE
jgi:hypothetical protein